ncbi:MAG: TonB-dependent siderophore receptor, partial [Pirellulaceae bacterium]|nr:TonB-dependent siderophore receptor [Pirellulaceae bacterium]
AVFGTLMLGIFASAQEVITDDPQPEEQVAVVQPAATQPPMVPVLPETEVEATRPAGAPDASPYDPEVDGSMFGSPMVRGYRAGSSTAGTIIDVPDLDLPATVNVVPRELLNDQQALNFTDAIRNAPGVFSAGDSLLRDRIYIRGLEVGSRDFRKDGFLDPTFVPRDFQNIERVEILKGPASMLYGAVSPSGLVNLVTKKPLNAQFSDLGFTFGAYQQQRYTLDTNGYASADGNTLYRINLAQEDMNSFRDFGFTSRTLVAPGITWKLNDCSTLTWLGEYHRDHRRGDLGVPAVNGDPLALPSDRFVGEPLHDRLATQEFRQTLLLNTEINDEWALRIGGHSLFYEFPGSTTAAAFDLGGGNFARSRSNILKENEQSHSLIANLAGDTWWGPFRHRSLVGMEYTYYDSDSTFGFGSVPPINVFNPVYTNPPIIPGGSADFPVFRQRRVGGYLQDLVDITPHWKLLGSVRFDSCDFEFDKVLNFGFPLPSTQDQVFNRVSPRAGVVYLPWEEEIMSLYFNYSESFAPPGGGIYINPTPLKPVTGVTYEGGMKTNLLEDLTLQVAGFHVTRENADLNSSAFFLVQVGEERSQGAEVSLMGQLTERWSGVANYTYVDTLLTDPLNPAFDGNRQRNVPFNSANFWTRYNLVQDDCVTFGAAVGLVYLGERPANLTNTLDLPGYSRWDMGVYYNRGSMYANLYVENIFDVKYAASSINEFQIFPGAPVNARAQVGWIY